MKTALKIICVTFLLAGFNYGQKPIQPKLIDAFKTTYYADVFEKLDNLLMKLGSGLDSEKNHLAIRICSAEPLPVAFVLAQGMPQYVIDNLKRYNAGLEINRPKISLLRQEKNCQPKKDGYHSTEYWIVANSGASPQSAETRNFDDLIVLEMPLTGNKKAREIEKESLQFLKERDKSWIVVKAKPFKYRANAASVKVSNLKNFLIKNGIQKNRVYIRNGSSFDKDGENTITLAAQK